MIPSNVLTKSIFLFVWSITHHSRKSFRPSPFTKTKWLC